VLPPSDCRDAYIPAAAVAVGGGGKGGRGEEEEREGEGEEGDENTIHLTAFHHKL